MSSQDAKDIITIKAKLTKLNEDIDLKSGNCNCKTAWKGHYVTDRGVLQNDS
jgi:hypothetical protein